MAGHTFSHVQGHVAGLFRPGLLPTNTAAIQADETWRHLLTNMVASYGLTGADSATFDDSGNGYLLTASSAVSTEAGVDAATGAVSLASNHMRRTSPESDFKIEDAEFVLAGWVYFANTGGTYPRLGIGDPGVSGGSYAFYPSRDGNWYWAARNAADSGFVGATKSMPAVGWHFVMCYHDPAANTLGMSIDGGAFTTAALSGGVYSGTGEFRIIDSTFTGRVQGWHIWKGSGVVATLTASEVLSYLYNSGTAARLRCDMEGATRAAVFDGNSLTHGAWVAAADSYPAVIRETLSSAYCVINRGIGGQTTDAMETAAANRIDQWLERYPNNSVLVAWEGSNDIQFGASLATAQSRWNTYFASRVAAGWASNGCKLVACTIIPRGDSNELKDAIVSDFNSWLRTNYSTYATHLVDLAADARLQNTADATYFNADTVHLTASGYAVVAELVSAYIG